jgi:hypothetical protein
MNVKGLGSADAGQAASELHRGRPVIVSFQGNFDWSSAAQTGTGVTY